MHNTRLEDIRAGAAPVSHTWDELEAKELEVLDNLAPMLIGGLV